MDAAGMNQSLFPGTSYTDGTLASHPTPPANVPLLLKSGTLG